MKHKHKYRPVPLSQLRKGSRVYWRDPDTGADCSGWGVATDIPDVLDTDSIVAIATDHGGYVECLPSEVYA